MRKICHELIAKTAKEMAYADYEIMARDNQFYKNWPNSRNWMRKFWPLYVEPARATLATMLRGNYSEALKQEVFDALILDAPFRNTGT